jgi:hypothetical protein
VPLRQRQEGEEVLRSLLRAGGRILTLPT